MIFPFFPQRMWQGKCRNIQFLQKHQGERYCKNSHTFCNSTVPGINCMICLEMFCLFWLSPHTGFNVYLPCYPFTHFTGFVASQVVFIGQWMKGLWCLLDLERGWLLVNSPGSPLALVRPGALQNCCGEPLSGPEGIQATTGLLCFFRRRVALLEGVAQRQVPVALRKL